MHKLLCVVAAALLARGRHGATAMKATPVAGPLWQQTRASVARSVTTGVLPATASRPALPVMLVGSQRSGGVGDQDVEAIHAGNGSLLWSSTALNQWTYSVALQPVVPGTGGELRRGAAGFGGPFSGHAAGAPPPPPLELGFWADAGSSASAPDWTMVIPNSTQNSGIGPPKAVFSADGRSLIVDFHGELGLDGQPIEYLGVVSVDSPTAVPMVTTLLGQGYGHSLTVLGPSSGTSGAGKRTFALVTRTNVTEQFGEVNEHFAMHYGIAPGSPIEIADAPIIDCNRTGDCRILDSSPDLSQILVTVSGTVSAHFPESALCKFEMTNPWRYGVALLTADVPGPDAGQSQAGGEHWPYAGYSVSWVKCSNDDSKEGIRNLASAHIVNKDQVVLTYQIMNGVVSGSGAVGLEACAISTAPGGDNIWCTDVTPISPPSTVGESSYTLEPNTKGAAGHVAVGISGFGILVVDGAAKSKPALRMVYDQGSNGDCCLVTALEIVTEQSRAGVTQTAPVATLVASIPNGKINGAWCQCFGSKLVGVAL